MYTFDQFTKSQILQIIEFAKNNVYQIDDILDMMNDQMDRPGDVSEHMVRIPIGQWICYYIVEHPHKGLCHYFQIKPDINGRLPDKTSIEYITKEFGIDSIIINDYISDDKANPEIRVVIPFSK